MGTNSVKQIGILPLLVLSLQCEFWWLLLNPFDYSQKMFSLCTVHSQNYNSIKLLLSYPFLGQGHLMPILFICNVYARGTFTSPTLAQHTAVHTNNHNTFIWYDSWNEAAGDATPLNFMYFMLFNTQWHDVASTNGKADIISHNTQYSDLKRCKRCRLKGLSWLPQ